MRAIGLWDDFSSHSTARLETKPSYDTASIILDRTWAFYLGVSSTNITEQIVTLNPNFPSTRFSAVMFEKTPITCKNETQGGPQSLLLFLCQTIHKQELM